MSSPSGTTEPQLFRAEVDRGFFKQSTVWRIYGGWRAYMVWDHGGCMGPFAPSRASAGQKNDCARWLAAGLGWQCRSPLPRMILV